MATQKINNENDSITMTGTVLSVYTQQTKKGEPMHSLKVLVGDNVFYVRSFEEVPPNRMDAYAAIVRPQAYITKHGAPGMSFMESERIG